MPTRIQRSLVMVILLLSLSIGTADASGPASARTSDSASLDKAARTAAVALAGEILALAKHPVPREHFTLRGAFTSYYEVSVVIASTASTPSQALPNYYALYADFPRPPGSRQGGVRTSDLDKLVAANVVEVVLNGGGQLILTRNTFRPFIDGGPPNTLNPGWLFHGGYLVGNDRFAPIGASTRPRTHELLFTLQRIAAVLKQGQALVHDAVAHTPTSFLPQAFARQPGKGASLPPPMF